MQQIRPSEMDHNTFATDFGGISEHSHWIAGVAYNLEVGPIHASAQGVHQMLTCVFRAASEEQRLRVLTENPDLAGKLAETNRLTVDSTAEQTSIGLYTQSDDERRKLTEMNDASTPKFGFPFNMSVHNTTKASIMEAVQRRIDSNCATELFQTCKQVERVAELRLIEKLFV